MISCQDKNQHSRQQTYNRGHKGLPCIFDTYFRQIQCQRPQGFAFNKCHGLLHKVPVFQNCSTSAATIPVLPKGIPTFRKIPSSLSPSILAASTILSGISEKKLYRTKTGKVEKTPGSIIAQGAVYGSQRLVLTLAIRNLPCTSFSYVLLRLKQSLGTHRQPVGNNTSGSFFNLPCFRPV